jgi:hypothetical protein
MNEKQIVSVKYFRADWNYFWLVGPKEEIPDYYNFLVNGLDEAKLSRMGIGGTSYDALMDYLEKTKGVSKCIEHPTQS